MVDIGFGLDLLNDLLGLVIGLESKLSFRLLRGIGFGLLEMFIWELRLSESKASILRARVVLLSGPRFKWGPRLSP